MNNLITTIVVAVAIFGSADPGAAATTSNSSLQSSLQAAYQAQCKDGVDRDYNALKATMTSNYLNTDVTGKSANAAQTVEDSKASFAQYNFSGCSTQILGIRTNGPEITVSILEITKGTSSGGVPIMVVENMTDTWDRGGFGRLQIAASKANELTIFASGRVVQHQIASWAKSSSGP